MRKIFRTICFAAALGAVATLGSCSSSDDEPTTNKRDGNDITSFSLTGVTGPEYVIDADEATVEIRVAADFDLTQLVDATPQINVSPAATISPAATEAQDFTKQVNYTVTAENGTPKSWKVYHVVSTHVSKGFRASRKVWTGPNDNGNIPTVGILGDYVLASRIEYAWNATTGASANVELNLEGVEDGRPFVFTNDDAGNLLGCNLRADPYFLPDNFKVYLWTSPDAAPRLIVNHPIENGQEFGRKLVARGDINSGNGYIVAYNTLTGGENNSSDHYIWKVTGGTAGSSTDVVSTGVQDQTLYQMLIPQTTASTTPAYVISRGQSAAAPPPMVGLLSAQGIEEFTGPLTEEEDFEAINVGWGNYIVHGTRFDFNGKAYLAVLCFTVADIYNYYTVVFDLDDNNNVVFKESIQEPGGVSTNPNYTGSINVKQMPDNGETLSAYLYTYISGTGTVAYELSNLYSF